MTRILLIGAAALAMSACQTTPTAYGPLADGKTGFYEQPIEDDRFRVTFVGKSEAEARDLALYRAAEIADQRGYPYFEVLYGATEGAEDAYRRGGTRTSVGIGVGSGGGYYGRRRGTNVGVGVGIDLGNVFGGGNRGRVAHSVEVKLRRTQSDAANVYSTEGILTSIGGRFRA